MRAGYDESPVNPVPAVIWLLALPIKSSVFMYIFLPTLVFQVALGLDLRRMLDDWVPILVMAVLAVIVATAFVGIALVPFSPMPVPGSPQSTPKPEIVITPPAANAIAARWAQPDPASAATATGPTNSIDTVVPSGMWSIAM